MIVETTRGREQGVALHAKIERLGVARLGRHRRSPLPEKVAYPLFVLGIADRLRVGDPQIDLERAIALAAELLGPASDAVGRRGQRAKPAHAAGVGDRRRESDRAGAGHGRLQDRDAQPEMPAKGFGALARALLLRHR
jgi:hypothetical protein